MKALTYFSNFSKAHAFINLPLLFANLLSHKTQLANEPRTYPRAPDPYVIVVLFGANVRKGDLVLIASLEALESACSAVMGTSS